MLETNKQVLNLLQTINSEEARKLYDSSKLRDVCNKIYKDQLKLGKDLKFVGPLLAHIRHNQELLGDA